MIRGIRTRLKPYLPKAVKLALERRSQSLLDKELWADQERISNLKNQFEGCEDVDDYLLFAKTVFGLNQKTCEITALLELLADHQPTVIGEIGTYRCGNLLLLGSNVPSAKKIIAIDQVFRQKAEFECLELKQEQTKFVVGNSRSARTISKVRKQLDGAQFDFLFIDGDHTYEGVKADFFKYRELVKEGGLIAFHDVVPDLTTRMKSDVPLSKCFAGGVPIFWSEIKNRYRSYEFIENLDQDGFGIGVIEYYRQENYG